MLKKYFLNKQNSIINENHKSRFVIVALAVALVVTGIDNYSLRVDKKVIVLPCGNPENAMWVGNTDISPEYMQSIGRDVLALALNVSPETVEIQDKEFLEYVTPSLRSYIEDHMRANAERVINNQVSQAFYADVYKVVYQTQTLYVKGYLKTYVGNEQISNVQQIYKIKFDTKNMTAKISFFGQLDPDKDKNEISEVGI